MCLLICKIDIQRQHHFRIRIGISNSLLRAAHSEQIQIGPPVLNFRSCKLNTLLHAAQRDCAGVINSTNAKYTLFNCIRRLIYNRYS